MSQKNDDRATKQFIMTSEVTLRDMFAAMALKYVRFNYGLKNKKIKEKTISKAYEIADAMFIEKKK